MWFQAQFPQVSHGKNLGGVSDDDGDSSEGDHDKDSESDGGVCPLKGGTAPPDLLPDAIASGGCGAQGLGMGIGGGVDGGGGGGSSSIGSSSSSSALRRVTGGITGLGSTWVHRPRLALYGPPG